VKYAEEEKEEEKEEEEEEEKEKNYEKGWMRREGKIIDSQGNN
jgi:hypothetical protein